MDDEALLKDLNHVDETAGYNPRFRGWLINHYSMWLEFVKAADEVRARGWTDYSAYVIINVMRWRANVRGTKFSMTNTFTPDLARMYNATRGPLFATAKRFGKETS